MFAWARAYTNYDAALIARRGEWRARTRMFTAIYRRLGPRGALAAWIVGVALVIALVVGLLGLAINRLQPPSQPSPSSATITMTRFDNGNSVLASVSARDGSTIWSQRLANPSNFSTIANGMYYTMGWVGGPGPTLSAYRLSDGARQWNVTPVNGNMRPLIVANGLVFYASGSPYPTPQETLSAIDATTGNAAWNVSLSGVDMMANVTAQVAANSDLLFLGSSNAPAGSPMMVTAVRVSDGSVAWSQTLSGQTASRQVGAARLSGFGNGPGRWLTASANTVFAADPSGAVTAFHAADGSVAWRSSAISSALIGASVTYGGVGLYVCQYTNFNARNPLLALDPATGRTLWQTTAQSCAGQLVEVDGVLYSASGNLSAIRASDGSVLWSDSPAAGDLSFLSLRVSEGVVVAAAAPSGGNAPVCSINVLPGGTSQCSSPGYVTALNAANGATYWRVDVYSGPYLVGDNWFGAERQY